MSKYPQKEAKKPIQDIDYIADIYSEYAKKIYDGGSIKEKLASALINSALAEFYVDKFIKSLINHIENNSKSTKVKFATSTINDNGNTNLEAALDKLKKFQYPDKQNIESIIKLIKKNRNDVFHNLMTANEKDISLDLAISIVNNKVPYLREQLVNSLLKIL